jgi:tetraacyldisaccharide 4'-kinase
MSRAFRFLLNTRERMYQSGLLRTLRLNHPVVSVGNLTLGGTGKTPLVIALAERFRDEGFRPVIFVAWIPTDQQGDRHRKPR